jgi:transcriptional regulator with XRE-family HTH domain
MRSSEYIMRERIKKDLSYRELAEKAGVSHSLISKWEKDEQIPSSEKAKKVVEALGLDCKRLQPIVESELAKKQAEKDLLKAEMMRELALQELNRQEWISLMRENLIVLSLKRKGRIAPALHAAASIPLLRDDRKDTRVSIVQGPFVTADGRFILVVQLEADTADLEGRSIAVERNNITLCETTIEAPDEPIELGQDVSVPVEALTADEKAILDEVEAINIEPSLLTFKLY